MEKITENEAIFLIATNASEESDVRELLEDLGRWDCSNVNKSGLVARLVEEGVIGIYDRSSGVDEGIPKRRALEISRNLEKSLNYVLFLTEEGWKRWDFDDWGIATKRAQYLMFSHKNVSR